MAKVLFILKRREDYNGIIHSQIGLSTGLYNSASFVNDMLKAYKIESNLAVVIDNNDIDREVSKYKPTHVVIEALWVTPSKFAVLEKLHPNVKWIIRLHSELPFMAGEGIAMDWLGDYSEFKNIVIACNAPRMLREIKKYLQIKNNWSCQEAQDKIIYLPNHYPGFYRYPRMMDYNKETIDVGCFGAIRLLKNHLVQAFAAIDLANRLGKKLRFHINAGRVEMKGEPVLHNLQGLFQQLYNKDHQLINHDWTPRANFINLCGQMDIGMQCNFSETFNIVGADFVSEGIPLIGSKEIPWLSGGLLDANNCADPTNSEDIMIKMYKAYKNPSRNVLACQKGLKKYCEKTESIWTKYFI